MNQLRLLSSLGLAAILTVALGACEKTPSRLDPLAKTPTVTATPTTPSPSPSLPSATPVQADHSGSVEERLTRLETYQAKHAEAVNFLAQVYAQQKAQQEAQEAGEPAPDAVFAVDIKDSLASGHVDGPATAPVTVVSAWDFACPHCQRAAGVFDELVKEYDGKLRVVFKHMVVHPQQVNDAHWASCAAAKQGKFKAFYRAFWEKSFMPYAASRDPSKLSKATFMEWSKEIGLDTNKLEADMSACRAYVEADMAELHKFRVSGTPAFFINGQFIGGGMPKEAFKNIIDEKLRLAEESGVSGADYYEKEIWGKGEKKFRSKKDPKPN